MRAQDHPHYLEEKRHLDITFEYIHTELERVRTPQILYDNKPTVRAYRDTSLETIQKLKDAQKEPYFGRIDWLPEDSPEEEVLYIGKVAIPERRIYSWAQGTLVADLYYTGRSSRENGKHLLKRTFEIEDKNLKSIIDEYVDPSLKTRLDIESYTDSLLLQLLQDVRSGQLRDIVTTIQQQQYHIIRSSKEQLLVVQGAPGSGKTQVALHRVAYLLYNHREELQDVLILAPNGMFLDYIANVLPALGERRIPQKTFDGWILEMLGPSLEYEPQDTSLEVLLDPERGPAERVMRYRNAQNKGSLKMATLLERYVEHEYDRVLASKEEPLKPGFRTLKTE